MKVKKRKAERKDSTRLRTYSFVATLVIIGVLVAGSYYQTLPTVEHIPDNFTFIRQEWMSYIPGYAEYVDYVDYSQAYAVSHNSSLFSSASVLQLSQLGFQIYTSDIDYEVDVQLPQPQFSGTATILQLATTRESNLIGDLSSLNSSKIAPMLSYDGYRVYELLMRRFGDQESSLGFLTVVNEQTILSNDKTSALQNVKAILDQVTSNRLSLFDDTNVRRAIFATGITDQQYVGLFVGMFPTQLNDTKMAVKSIIGVGDAIQVSRALLFPSSDVALSRLDQAHKIYKYAASYRILDSWLVVTYTYPLSRLPAELTGI